jgi:hypothetical protein
MDAVNPELAPASTYALFARVAAQFGEIEDVVRGEAAAVGAAIAAVAVKSDARRGLVAKVQLQRSSPALRAALGRYAFAAEITET